MHSLQRSAFAAKVLVIAAMLVMWVGQSARADAIGRANLDGTNVNPNFIGWTANTGPGGLAVNGSNLFWANSLSWTIGRANLDGTGANQNFVPSGGSQEPSGVAVNATHIYWTNAAGGSLGGPPSPGIGRANLDGTGVNNSFISVSGFNILPTGVAVDGSFIYFTTGVGNTIDRANLDGTGVTTFITGASAADGIAVNGSFIYWANGNSNTIGRANLDGTGVNQNFITGADQPNGVAIDGTHIYWNNSFGTTIGRANLDGTNVNQSFLDVGRRFVDGVAVDGTSIYFAPGIIPEPATGLLVMVGVLGLAVSRRRAGVSA